MISLRIPGSKSITNRAIFLAALANGKSEITGGLESDDSTHAQRACKALRISIRKSDNVWKISGGRLRPSKNPIFCGNAGTAMRFLTAILAAHPFSSVLDGDKRMRQRPIEDLLVALRRLGARAVSLDKQGFPPVKVAGPLLGGKCVVRGNISSQFLSGLLLASPLARSDVEIAIQGDLVSKPYVDMTLDLMRRFGVRVIRNGYKKFFVRAPQQYKAKKIEIEGDASSAVYFWGISALTGENIKITNIPQNSLQADAAAKKFAERPASKLNCADFPDGAMALAVLAAFRKGKTELTGLGNLRMKECDRLHALSTELRKIGCRASERKNGLVIFGEPKLLHGALIETYNDHRIAMCFGMASVILKGIRIKNPSCVKKTYPCFWKDIEFVKSKLNEKNIVLTGMRGTGKTKLGQLLAEKLKRRFIDIDKEIEKSVKMPIGKFVKRFGWKKFRIIEKNIVKKIVASRRVVIATGGGTLMNSTNAKLLKKNSRTIWLNSSIPILKKRLAKSKNRPSLTNKNFLSELGGIYQKRHKIYEMVSDGKLDVSHTSQNKTRDFMEKISALLEIISRWGII